MGKVHISEAMARQIFRKTADRCHVCGQVLIFEERGAWAIDHVYPKQLGGPNEFSNYLLVCTRCNGLRWDHSPEALRRILFLGVIANQKGYQTPFGARIASEIRELRAERLIDNWARRQRPRPSFEDRELAREAFEGIEQFVLKRVLRPRKQAGRNVWDQTLKAVIQSEGTPAEWKRWY